MKALESLGLRDGGGAKGNWVSRGDGGRQRAERACLVEGKLLPHHPSAWEGGALSTLLFPGQLRSLF